MGRTPGTTLPPWMRYGPMLWPPRFRTLRTGSTPPPGVTTSYDSITSWAAAPRSANRTSMPAAATAASVAPRAAARSGAAAAPPPTVHALSMIRPATWVPKSTLTTSPAASTRGGSPGLGVSWAATSLRETPVGKAHPPARPSAARCARVSASRRSTMERVVTPGRMWGAMARRTRRCASAACRSRPRRGADSRSRTASSSSLVRYALASV
ncbi:hypothetical protein I4F81_011243 [Pyropia yezoensis]|uniref:Uncharacterized protein n=1 Tax=Pyropia yezoensis TaxID=2788 RepID=A0ACC3CFP8_PYRYE|nr:hypothetical protein I4F81_011243 [Neopyropia yezoensis]